MGPDAVQYLTFQKFIIVYILFTTLISIGKITVVAVGLSWPDEANLRVGAAPQFPGIPARRRHRVRAHHPGKPESLPPWRRCLPLGPRSPRLHHVSHSDPLDEEILQRTQNDGHGFENNSNLGNRENIWTFIESVRKGPPTPLPLTVYFLSVILKSSNKYFLLPENIPLEYCEISRLKNYFTECYPDHQVSDIQIAYDVSKLISLTEKYKNTTLSKKYRWLMVKCPLVEVMSSILISSDREEEDLVLYPAVAARQEHENI